MLKVTGCLTWPLRTGVSAPGLWGSGGWPADSRAALGVLGSCSAASAPSVVLGVMAHSRALEVPCTTVWAGAWVPASIVLGEVPGLRGRGVEALGFLHASDRPPLTCGLHGSVGASRELPERSNHSLTPARVEAAQGPPAHHPQPSASVYPCGCGHGSEALAGGFPACSRRVRFHPGLWFLVWPHTWLSSRRSATDGRGGDACRCWIRFLVN